MTAKRSQPDQSFSRLRDWLETHARQFQRPEFIADDPICIPHRFTRVQDIEIAGFFTATMAWGRRATIIQKAAELMELMDGAPHAFITGHEERDLQRFLHFRHRTLQPDDVLYLIAVLRDHYRRYASLEDAFCADLMPDHPDVAAGLNGFYRMVFDRPEVMERTRKHVSAPMRKSACKRLNMYLRWMVRPPDAGVDFGLWQRIRTDQLVIPLDVHVGRVARELGLLNRPQYDWQAAVELTDALRRFDPHDPVRYDFALFGAGMHGLTS